MTPPTTTQDGYGLDAAGVARGKFGDAEGDGRHR
jgi:hypothetical protein